MLLMSKQYSDKAYLLPAAEGLGAFGSVNAALMDIISYTRLSVTDARGSLHFGQFHGGRVDVALELEMCHIWPEPTAGAIRDMEGLWPFVFSISTRVTDPAEHYGTDCAELAALYGDALELIDLLMNEITPPITYVRGKKKKVKRMWAWLTSPSSWTLRMHSPKVFQQRCQLPGGLAGRSAEASELAHKVPRRAWHAHSFLGATKMASGYSQWWHALSNVYHTHFAFVSNAARFGRSSRAMMRRHEKRRDADRAMLERVRTVLARAAACARSEEECERTTCMISDPTRDCAKALIWT
jgi:hypothetical protein